MWRRRRVEALEVERVRLEGHMELLEAALPRYAKVARWLRSSGPKPPAELVAFVDALHRDERALAEALGKVERHARARGWPARHPFVICAGEVHRLRAEIVEQAAKRFRFAGAVDVGEALILLMDPARRRRSPLWTQANRVLAIDAPLFSRIVTFAEELDGAIEALHLHDDPAPLERLAGSWDDGERARNEAWKRLEVIGDGSVRNLRGQRLRNMAKPRSAAEWLVHAERARERLLLAIDRRVRDATERTHCREGEHAAIAAWLVRESLAPGARLASDARISEGRAGLWELARALRRVRESPISAPIPWAELTERAVRADLAGDDGDVHRLIQTICTITRTRRHASRPHVPPLYRVRGLDGHAPSRANSLSAAVAEARALELSDRHR